MEKTTEQTTVTVGRPINGITINGDELLLDDNNNIMEFTSKDEAYNFLRSNGIDLTDEEMEESFNFYVNGEL
jgi:hypothetical protein